MRAAMFSLIWLGCIALAEAQTAAPTPTASLSPKTVVEAVADPSKAESQNFDIEYLSRSFAFSIDRLSVQLRRSMENANDRLDRKSTRLNSSHTVISYAVFCLKKKTLNCPGNLKHID